MLWVSAHVLVHLVLSVPGSLVRDGYSVETLSRFYSHINVLYSSLRIVISWCYQSLEIINKCTVVMMTLRCDNELCICRHSERRHLVGIDTRWQICVFSCYQRDFPLVVSLELLLELGWWGATMVPWGGEEVHIWSWSITILAARRTFVSIHDVYACGSGVIICVLLWTALCGTTLSVVVSGFLDA